MTTVEAALEKHNKEIFKQMGLKEQSPEEIKASLQSLKDKIGFDYEEECKNEPKESIRICRLERDKCMSPNDACKFGYCVYCTTRLGPDVETCGNCLLDNCGFCFAKRRQGQVGRKG